jgi:hypothetical protein
MVLDNPVLLPDGSENNPDNVEHNFIIPIHYGICHTLPKKIRDTIFTDSLRMVLNSYVRKSIPWYQQMWFAIVKMIIVFIISVISWGSLTPAMIAAMTATDILINVLIMIAIGLAFKLVAATLGPEYAGVLAVVSLILAGVSAYTGFGSEFSLAGMPTAQLFLQASIALFEGIASTTAEMIEDIYDELSDLAIENSDKLAALQAATDELLGTGFLLEPWDLISAVKRLSFADGFLDETPGEFFNRTLQGNPGVLTLSVIPNYFDTKLALPMPSASYKLA